jgi:hypothetical protein
MALVLIRERGKAWSAERLVQNSHGKPRPGEPARASDPRILDGGWRLSLPWVSGERIFLKSPSLHRSPLAGGEESQTVG